LLITWIGTFENAASVGANTVSPELLRAWERRYGLLRPLEALRHDRPAGVGCRSDDEFRAVEMHSLHQPLAPVAGGRAAESDWRRAVDGMIALLGRVSRHVAYAHVRRGWEVDAALGDQFPSYDWPQRLDLGAGHSRMDAYEDHLAPDAFGVQLLGESYAPVPDRASWKAEPAEAGTLLVHRELEQWFDEPFVPFKEQVAPAQRPQPEILLAARRELEPLLLRR
jgi:hypothetical protein